MMNGSDGIPLTGKTVEYATELWLDGPSAFWLHPEGPLSETTPEEYLEKQKPKDQHKTIADMMNEQAASSAMLGGYANAAQLNYLAQMRAAQSHSLYSSVLQTRRGLGNHLGGIFSHWL